VNRDGYADVVIGARWYSFGEVNEGAAYVFYGSPGGLESSPRWFFESGQESAAFGSAVGGAGDVNQDGYDDILVGAPSFDNGDEDEGRVFVFLGSMMGVSAAPDWQVDGGQEGAWFGTSASGAGDVNGDGYADILVGAPNYTTSGVTEGCTMLFSGSPGGLSTEPTWTSTSHQSITGYGYASGTAGDVNADGYSDLVIGAYMYDDDQPDEGGLFIFLGSPDGPVEVPVWVAFGNKAEAWLGFSVANAGDVNGDHFTDFLGGAPIYRHDETISGRVFGFLGKNAPTPGDFFLVFLPIITGR
jgi:hypothetical protein